MLARLVMPLALMVSVDQVPLRASPEIIHYFVTGVDKIGLTAVHAAAPAPATAPPSTLPAATSSSTPMATAPNPALVRRGDFAPISLKKAG